MQYAIEIKASNDVNVIEMPTIDDSGLGFLQSAVGGMIEHLDIRCENDSLDLWLNEEGLLLGLPYNAVASYLVSRTWLELHYPSDDAFIVGDVILTTTSDEGDLKGMTQAQVQSVLDSITRYAEERSVPVIDVTPK